MDNGDDVPYEVQMGAIMRAAGFDGGDFRASTRLLQSASTVFVRAYEAMYRTTLAGKYPDPQTDAESAWNAELLITQLQGVTKMPALKGLSGYQVVSRDERAIHLLVTTLWSEGRRLLMERSTDPNAPSSSSSSSSRPQARGPASANGTQQSVLPSLSASAAPKIIAHQHRNLKKSSDKRIATPTATAAPSTSAAKTVPFPAVAEGKTATVSAPGTGSSEGMSSPTLSLPGAVSPVRARGKLNDTDGDDMDMDLLGNPHPNPNPNSNPNPNPNTNTNPNPNPNPNPHPNPNPNLNESASR